MLLQHCCMYPCVEQSNLITFKITINVKKEKKRKKCKFFFFFFIIGFDSMISVLSLYVHHFMKDYDYADDGNEAKDETRQD